MNKEEIWKPINGYEGFYEVSNMGRVRSLDRIILSGGAFPKKNHKGRIIKPVFDTCRYLRLKLHAPNNRKQYSVHRLVAEAFIPNPENKPQVNHKNGIKTDNSVDNLEWVTHSENARHAFATGLNFIQNTKGESNGMSKLNDEIVTKIISILPHRKNSEIARMFGVSPPLISNIRYNKLWKHIPR